MYEDRILNAELRKKVISAETAATLIKSDMTLGCSGFTAVGYPKIIPKEIVRQDQAKNLTVLSGASTGDEMDGVMARAGIIGYRTPFNVNRDLRKGINDGTIRYADQHLGHLPQLVRSGVFGKIDVAIIECCGILENGEIIPTLSVGSSNAFAECADKVILELNVSHPLNLRGIHDIVNLESLPTSNVLPIRKAGEKIGVDYIKCDYEKIIGIVVTEEEDQEPRFIAPDEVSQRIADNIISLLKDEVKKGRLPNNFTIQSGFGAVANAVLYGLDTDEFNNLDMYTEVVQDGAMELILKGKIKTASATSLCLSKEGRKKFYANLNELKERMVIRPQDISNNCGIIRRLGVVAMNTAIEVDIYGNVNSTHIMGSSMMNGLGGSGDFARNSLLTIFMTPSTAKNGTISSIVPMVSHVDHTEHDTHIIVTEYGYADLRGLSPKERAELIIEKCAHPEYKPMLKDYFERAKKIANGQQTPHDLKTALSWHQRYLETGSMK